MTSSTRWPAFRLSCPVRDCGRPLDADASAKHLSCERGHTFDRARSGYVSLVQPQDRRSVRAGDAPEAAAARSRWLARGHMDGLLGVLTARLAAAGLGRGARIVEAGCGDGWAVAAVAERLGLEACGIDLSKAALERAARHRPDAVWIAANADRRLPFPDGSVDAVASVFGRRNPGEFGRILAPGGVIVAAVPGPDDLVELRSAILGQAVLEDRLPAVLAEFRGFEELERERWTVRRELDRNAIADLLASTYRGVRRRERGRADALASLAVTLSADVAILRPG